MISIYKTGFIFFHDFLLTTCDLFIDKFAAY
jgi:hypothetical protein